MASDRFEPSLEEEVVLEVTYEEYSRVIDAEGAFNIACMATVQGTDFEYFAQDDFRVRKPDIKFIVNPHMKCIKAEHLHELLHNLNCFGYRLKMEQNQLQWINQSRALSH